MDFNSLIFIIPQFILNHILNVVKGYECRINYDYHSKSFIARYDQKNDESRRKIRYRKKLKIAIAIMDEHGNLKHFQRMDGNNFVSVRMSQLKAYTSASIPISTKALAERNEALKNGPYLGVPGIVLLEGGLPIITKDGQSIGAIGVSGANPEMDGLCAQAALDAIKEECAAI